MSAHWKNKRSRRALLTYGFVAGVGSVVILDGLEHALPLDGWTRFVVQTGVLGVFMVAVGVRLAVALSSAGEGPR